MGFLLTPEAWAVIGVMTVVQVVLGVDNLVICRS